LFINDLWFRLNIMRRAYLIPFALLEEILIHKQRACFFTYELKFTIKYDMNHDSVKTTQIFQE
jgi:hypothetical protein